MSRIPLEKVKGTILRVIAHFNSKFFDTHIRTVLETDL